MNRDAPHDPSSASPPPSNPVPLGGGRPFDAPPQFGLSALLGATAAAAVLLAVARQIGGWAFLGVAWLGALAAAHVAGTACGHRIYGRRPARGSVSYQEAARSRPQTSGPRRPPTVFEQHRLRFAGLSRAALAAGAALGVGVGCGLALQQPWTARSFNGLVVTALSMGVLGGVLGWGLSCPLRVFLAGCVRNPPSAEE